MYMGVFCNLLIVIISLPLYRFLSLLCLLSHFFLVSSVYFLGFRSFHSGFWISVFWSLDFCPSFLVCVTPSDFFSIFNSGVCLLLSLSRLLPLWISISFSGFLYSYFIGFYPSFVECLILPNLYIDSHLS